MSGPRPRLDVRVSAPSIQLDDFPLPERLSDGLPKPITTEALRQTASKVTVRTERLLGAGFLRRLDAYLDVDVQEVLSGSDRLADGSLRVQVVDGHVYLGPAVVNIPGEPCGSPLSMTRSYPGSSSRLALTSSVSTTASLLAAWAGQTTSEVSSA